MLLTALLNSSGDESNSLARVGLHQLTDRRFIEPFALMFAQFACEGEGGSDWHTDSSDSEG